MGHYLLPSGNVQIAFSGGRTSGYMLHQILSANGSLSDKGIEITFQNTGRELPQTLDFVAEVSRRWGVMITWLEYRAQMPLFEIVGYQGASRNGEPFEALIRKRKALPNQFQKFCSAELKTLTAKRYLRSLGWKNWHSFVGFRADEQHRKPYDDNRSKICLPLVQAGVTKQDVVDFWKRQPFDLALPTVRGKTIGGNCDGCFLKSEAYLAAFAETMPTLAAWWENQESKSGRQWSKRYSRKELRLFMENQYNLTLSIEGMLCQKNDGEC